jgi:pilus assembly protein CpaE
MSKPNNKANDGSNRPVIKILLVDDIAETRESIKKLLSFESEFTVIGSAGNGREGVELAKQLKPDIIIMDINMPDMDGLEAANRISKAVPFIGIIMMSVQDDADYMQKAMLAGARFFLTKPVNMDQLYSTIRNVYEQFEMMRKQFEAINSGKVLIPDINEEEKAGGREGFVIVVYSPQGGCGKTTIASSIASGLMKEGIKTLLVDARLDFGDCAAFLNISAQSTTLADIVENINDLDIEYFDRIVMTHNSGMKVLLAPPNPRAGAEIRDNMPDAVARIIQQIAGYYDFVVVDTGSALDTSTSHLLEMANKIVLITTPTLPAIKNTRHILNLFQESGFEPGKISIVLNRAIEKPTQKTTPPPDKIQQYLKHPIDGIIPLVDENIILNAITKGVPVIASDRDTSRAPIRQLMKYSDFLYVALKGEETKVVDEPKKRGGWSLFGNS